MAIMEIKIEKTQNPKQKPDQNNLGFGSYFSDHMFIMDYTEGFGWHDPRIIPYQPIQMDPASMVLHYGQAVFEGMKCYINTEGQPQLFRPDMNFKRLNISDERLCIPHIDEEFAVEALKQLIRIDRDWIPQKDGTSLYIRPFTIATEASVGVRPSATYKFIIILSPVGAYYATGINPVGICIEEEYVRAVKGGIGFTKATANYASSLKGQEKAKKKGFSQVLWLDGVERKYIEEVGTMNVFFKIDGKIVTPALEGSILPGITRDSIITLLTDWGYEVEERKISIDELLESGKNGKLEEAFGTGTAAVVSPIGSFAYADIEFKVGKGETGEVTTKLYNELTGIQYGRVADRFGWVVRV